MDELKKLKEIGTKYLAPKEELIKELMKWYHRSDDNKHRFIREFLDKTEEEI